MIVYFDTEFTDLTDASGPIRLISAGFLAENGSEFYFELNDNYTKKELQPICIGERTSTFE